MYFCHIPKRPKLGSISTISFEEDLNITKRKAIGDLTTKALRNRLCSLKSHVDTVAQNEGVSPKTLATYLLLLCSNEDLNFSSAKVCKEIIKREIILTSTHNYHWINLRFLLTPLKLENLSI